MTVTVPSARVTTSQPSAWVSCQSCPASATVMRFASRPRSGLTCSASPRCGSGTQGSPASTRTGSVALVVPIVTPTMTPATSIRATRPTVISVARLDARGHAFMRNRPSAPVQVIPIPRLRLLASPEYLRCPVHRFVKLIDGLLRALPRPALGTADRPRDEFGERGVVVAAEHVVEQPDVGETSLAVHSRGHAFVGAHADQLAAQ